MSKVHIAAFTAAGRPFPGGIRFKGYILGCADAWWQRLSFERREQEAADERLEVCDLCASLYSSQCCEQRILTQKGRQQAQAMNESSEVSAMYSLFGDDRCSMIIQKFAETQRVLAAVNERLRRFRQEDNNDDGRRAVSLIAHPTVEIRSQSMDTDELRELHDSVVSGPETLGGQVSPSGSNLVSTSCTSRYSLALPFDHTTMAVNPGHHPRHTQLSIPCPFGQPQQFCQTEIQSFN
jgi:hypothetical protein